MTARLCFYKINKSPRKRFYSRYTPPTQMMLRWSLVLLWVHLLLATYALEREECGAFQTDEEKEEMTRTLAEVNLNFKRQTGSLRNYTFGVYFNVVASNMTAEGGWIPEKQIEDQMALMNRHYVVSGIAFRTLGITRILSRYWHQTVDLGLTQTDRMHRLFHKGGSQHLNVYTVGFYTNNLNGYATFPSSYKTIPHRDGVVMLFTTLPGGASQERQGSTLVHETGHWLGLRHTFENGCNAPGDGVADTGAEATAARGCPVGRKSCPDSDLPDPIHNFMDYTDETCRTEFTPGQVDLMQRSIIAYRSNAAV